MEIWVASVGMKVVNYEGLGGKDIEDGSGVSNGGAQAKG